MVGVPDEEAARPLIEALHPKAIVTTPDLAERLGESLSSLPYDLPLITCGLPSAMAPGGVEMPLSYLVKPVSQEALTTLMAQVERNGQTTVLVVDDDPDAVQLIERMLTSLPRRYRIHKAYDGQQALEVMQEVLPDVVLLDLVMPELDGKQTIARMRADARTRDVPVIIVSAQDRQEEELSLTTPISVQRRQPVDIASGAKCLQALLDSFRPSYLPEAGAS
jgi:CheY-like chemotaxis protein